VPPPRGASLLTATGSVAHGRAAGVESIRAALDAAGAPFEMLDPQTAARRWPGLRFDGDVCFQPDGGRVESAAALAAFMDRATRHGAEVLSNTPVRALDPSGDRVRVITDEETYDAPVAVVAAGAWTASLLAPHVALPPLVVTQESAFHFAPRELIPWPSFIHHGDVFCYGLETPGEGVKVAEHHAGPVVTAGRRDFVVDAGSRARVVDFVTRFLPGLDPAPASEVTCLYTSTPDETFVLERTGPIVAVSACSGHGFKFAPEIGRRAADLALEGRS
jgi:sarcosine oxidase